jgi:hypothetical protein
MYIIETQAHYIPLIHVHHRNTGTLYTPNTCTCLCFYDVHVLGVYNVPVLGVYNVPVLRVYAHYIPLIHVHHRNTGTLYTPNTCTS